LSSSACRAGRLVLGLADVGVLGRDRLLVLGLEVGVLLAGVGRRLVGRPLLVLQRDVGVGELAEGRGEPVVLRGGHPALARVDLGLLQQLLRLVDRPLGELQGRVGRHAGLPGRGLHQQVPLVGDHVERVVDATYLSSLALSAAAVTVGEVRSAGTIGLTRASIALTLLSACCRWPRSEK
jgi:hypothetical protein